MSEAEAGAGARVRSIDPATLPKHFDSLEAEARWDEAWQKSGIYHWDPSRPRESPTSPIVLEL